MVAQFESDLTRLRTREGMTLAKAAGRLRAKQTKLNRRQEGHPVSLVHRGEYSLAEVTELFDVGGSTVYRAIERQWVEARAGLAEAVKALTPTHGAGCPASDTPARCRRRVASMPGLRAARGSS